MPIPTVQKTRFIAGYHPPQAPGFGAGFGISDDPWRWVSNSRKMVHKTSILGSFFVFDWPFLHSKTSLFFAPKKAKSCVFNKSLSLFPLI
jgi:hypothetical protein